ncbi:hypothetical protein N7490_003290 [Penicillium lividum]|nr:hypothetical protein N7490_003290 [Penicillium lividum]
MSSLTSVWHNAPYPAISPHRKELSASGKTIIITGAGTGIGQATALAFARSGAAKIVLIGRKEETLLATQNVTDEAAITAIAAVVGTWDIMILAAGSISPKAHLREASTNVKGTMITTHAFLPTANPTRSAVVAFTTAVFMPAAMLTGLSSYVSSKLTLIKVMEFLAAENPNVFAAALHPGIVDTANFRASGADARKLPMDSVDLPAEFAVWLTSPEVAFLNGRFAMANWDAEELKTKADQIQSGMLLTSGVGGWPFSPN